MYNINSQKVFNYKTKIYVCKKLEPTINQNTGNQEEHYSEPIKYMFNIQSVSEDSETREFGELTNSMKVALITEKNKYINVFDEFDKVYINNIPNADEIEYGENADYRIYSVRPQNTSIRIYLLKLTK